MESCYDWNYKRWTAVLDERILMFLEESRETFSPAYSELCALFDTCLSSLNKMPRIWIMYLEFLVLTRDITRFRRAVNSSLQALPVTQHNRVWDVVMNKFVHQTEFRVPLLTVKLLFRRYIQISPGSRDEFVDYLIGREDYSDAVQELITSIQLEEDNSLHYMNYFKLVNIISKNSNKLSEAVRSDLDLPSIIRAGLSKFPDEIGNLWNHLADYYIRLGLFTKAMDVFEEALDKVVAVVDFSIVFNSYQSFLDLLVKTKLEQASPDVELDLLRLENLLERRPDMLSLVLLRQNPHNVNEWIKRTKLARIAGDPESVIKTFSDGISQIDPSSGTLVGRVSSLWIEFSRFHSHRGETPQSRSILEKAVLYPFKHLDELASVWVEWILFEVRLVLAAEDSDKSNVVEVTRRAINQWRGSPKGTIQSQLFRSVKLWNLALDIEEWVHGAGNPDMVRAVFNAMMELKVITPLLLLSYSKFEYSRNYFDRSVQILQKGIGLFPWPNCRDIWISYLDQVANLQRKRHSTDRIRDLFASAVADCPVEHVSIFYFQWFKFELEEGFASDAVHVLRVASQRVALSDQPGFAYLLLNETLRSFRSSACRRVFEQLIAQFSESKHDQYVLEFCMGYSAFEEKLNQIERARKLLVHGSQFADPKKYEYFWNFWKNFEISHGTQITYREMKRVRRAVDVMYSDKHYNAVDAGMEEEEPAVHAATKAETVEVTSAPKLAAGIDLSRLQQAAGASFEAAPEFQGSRPGYAFKTGPQGLGYYKLSE